jgi:hypothetical protein
MAVVAHEQTVIAPLEERLAERLEALRANRTTFIADAQRQLAALDAAIAELGALLDPATARAGLNGASDAEEK